MMRIGVFKDYAFYPSETFIREQSSMLNRHNDVYILSFSKIENSLTAGMNIIDYQVSNKKLAILASKMFSIYPREWLTRIQNLKLDVLHAHFGTSALHILMLRKILNIPLITTFHGYDTTVEKRYGYKVSLNYQLYIFRRKRVFKESSKIIAVSNFIKQELVKLGCNADKIEVNYIGIDLDKFNSYSRKKDRDKVILFVGRLVEVKGCWDAIRAFEMLKLPDYKMIFIGDGNQFNRLKEYCQSRGLNVQFDGLKSHIEVIKAMSTAQILIGPSKTDSRGQREALGMVFVEAQAVGTPVVSYKSGGIPEAVINEKTGLLAEEGDVEGLAHNMRILLENRSLWENYSKNARRHVEENFNMEIQIGNLLGIYFSSIRKEFQ